MATLKGQRLGPKAVTINEMILWVTYSDTKSASQEKKEERKHMKYHIYYDSFIKLSIQLIPSS